MNYPQNECSDFFKTLFVENLTREECHTILVWKEKWEEIRQKSVKDWKINEAENPMVWMQEISLLCHPSVNGSSLSFFQISHLLWAQPKCYEKLQISRKLKNCIWLDVGHDYSSSWIYQKTKPWILLFAFQLCSDFSFCYPQFYPWFFPCCFVSDLNCSSTEMGRQMTFLKLF